MKDALGYRALFGVLAPSTNTIVQPEFDWMRPAGVTNHYSRIYTPNAQAVSNETFIGGVQVISSNLMDAVHSIKTCSPDYLVLGVSAIVFFGGVEGAQKVIREVTEEAGVGISVGSIAVAEALRAYGNIKNVAFVSPYFPAMNIEVKRFLEESGFNVLRDRCLQCPSWTDIAKVDEATLRPVLSDELDGDDVDALVQVGTNLCMAKMAGEAERWLSKPVVAINTATYWHALRANGIKDKIPGFGSLLWDH